MLQHEISPFAQAHRNVIDELIASIEPPEELADDDSVQLTLNYAGVTDIIEKLRTTKRGFDRFEACALDEWKQKEVLLARDRQCRRTHRDM